MADKTGKETLGPILGASVQESRLMNKIGGGVASYVSRMQHC